MLMTELLIDTSDFEEIFASLLCNERLEKSRFKDRDISTFILIVLIRERDGDFWDRVVD